MAYKKSKKAPFDKNCVMEALHLRDCSIRKLDDANGFGWSSKSVERGLRDREVSPDLLDALGKYPNVEHWLFSWEVSPRMRKSKGSIYKRNMDAGIKSRKISIHFETTEN